MNAKVWLRIAVLFIIIHLLGHAVGHLSWDEPEDAGMRDVVDSMVGYKAEFMGASRSMADYYNGYSVIMFFLYAMSISVLWAASTFPENLRYYTRKILYPVAITYLAFGIIEFMYFFPFAAFISFGAGVLIFVAIFKLRADTRT